MLLSLTKKTSFRKIFFVFTILLFVSCQKEATLDNENIVAPDLSTKVSSSVSGFVTDEHDAAVKGASVVVGSATTTTDKYGFFEVKNVQVVKEAAVVTIIQPGYFKGIKTYMAVANKSAFFRIKLLPKTIAGTIDAASGGNVTLPNGLKVALPADAVVTASGNAAYTGVVNVALKYIDPTATDVNKYMPGDLRGLDTDGALKLLTSYGMAAVELTGASGELLQIASGKKATLTAPIPASISSTAPATIPLWYFDETKGLWKQEGTATKTGNSYVGNVAHFSFWNYDTPSNYVHFDCTIVDPAGQPIPHALVVLSIVGTNSYAMGATDMAGYVGGPVPSNAQLKMEVYSGYNCAVLLYTQNFSTVGIDVSLGNITINVPLQTAFVSGTITDCNNAPVSNGDVVMLKDNEYWKFSTTATGTYNFTLLMCSGNINTVFIGEDLTANVQSMPLNQTLTTGNNVIPNLQACGTSNQEFLTYTDNGGAPINFTVPTDTMRHSVQGNLDFIGGIHGTNTYDAFYITYEKAGAAVGSSQNMNSLYATAYSSAFTLPTPSVMHITEYGAVGQFIAGNFSLTVSEAGAPANTHNIVCSFRVRRTQ